MKTNKEYQKAYRERRTETHERFVLYIPKEDYQQVLALAQAQGWINTTGRNAGDANVQHALVEILQRGLATYPEITGNCESSTKVEQPPDSLY